MITWDNYEEYMMMHADGELKPAEEQALMNFVFEHPELQNELVAYTMTKMTPDNTLTYTQKATLTKPEYTTKIVPFINWKRSAIAAGVAALVCLSLYKFAVQPNDTTDVAGINNPINTTIVNNTNNNTNNNSAANDEKTIATVTNTTPYIATINDKVATLPTRKTEILAKSTQTPVSIKKDKEITTALAINALNKDDIDKIEPIYATLSTDEKNNFSVAVTKLPDVAIYTDNEQTTQSFLDKLPIDELKKEGMENVASALASGYDKVNAIRHSISATSISLKLQNKKLTVSF